MEILQAMSTQSALPLPRRCSRCTFGRKSQPASTERHSSSGWSSHSCESGRALLRQAIVSHADCEPTAERQAHRCSAVSKKLRSSLYPACSTLAFSASGTPSTAASRKSGSPPDSIHEPSSVGSDAWPDL